MYLMKLNILNQLFRRLSMKNFLVGGVSMTMPIILGAGVAKHPNQVLPYLHPDAPLGAALSGSYTLESREGNNGTLMWPADLGGLMQHGFGLNAWGMPNLGLAQAMELFPSDQTKPHVVSIAGFKSSDYTDMLHLLKGNKQIAGVEINAGCPNTGHLPAAYDVIQLITLLNQIEEVGFNKPLWLKLSPYMTKSELDDFTKNNPTLNFENVPWVQDGFLDQLCALLLEHKSLIKAIVISNTLPNVTHDNSIVVKNDNGSVHNKGGLSGPILLAHNLMLVKTFSDYLSGHIDIIGCGGIITGDDALAYLQSGCAGVQCTSGPAWSDIRFFQSLLEGSEGLQEYLVS